MGDMHNTANVADPWKPVADEFPWRLTDDGVAVLPAQSAEVSKGGVHLPTARERPLEGWVVAVGPGRRESDGSITKPPFAIGDRVLFAKYAGFDVHLDVTGRTCTLMKLADVRGWAR